MKKTRPRIFVLYFHQLLPNWGFDKYYKTFEWELRYLKSRFRIVTPDDILEYLENGRSPGKDSVCLTFDDGLLDNFVYGYPLLKKHQVKATLFTITSRIYPGEAIRPTLEDYWNNKVSFSELLKPIPMGQAHREYFEKGMSPAFMTLPELRKSYEFLQVEGHADIHARSFYQDEIVDLYDGSNGHYSDYHSFGEAPVTGFPLFPRRNNISVNQGILSQDVKDYVKSLPGEYFSNPDWKDRLKQELTQKFPLRLTIETTEQRKERVWKELSESRKELEARIEKPVNYFAYPFGDHDDAVADVCAKVFKASFTTRKDFVRPGTPLQKIPRGSVAKDFLSFLARTAKMEWMK